MKSLFRLFAVGALLTASLGFAADAFQGKMTLVMTAGKAKPMTMNISIKDHLQRTDMQAEGNTVSMIMDAQKLEMLILMPEQQMYMVQSIKKPVEKAVEKAGKSESTADIEVTGKTETILGYKCNQVIIRDKNSTTEVWMAEGLGVFMGLGQSGGGGGPMGGMFGGRGKSAAEAKWEEALKGKAGFPLRVITQDAKGKEAYRMDVTKIEPGSLPASLFQPPAGYQKFQMPGMGGLLKGIGG